MFTNFLNSNNMRMINKFRKIDNQLMEDLKKDIINQEYQHMFLKYLCITFMKD